MSSIWPRQILHPSSSWMNWILFWEIEAMLESTKHPKGMNKVLATLELNMNYKCTGNYRNYKVSITCRCKAEFLVKMDGLVSCSKPVFLIGATNMPWALDPALLRRFETTFYIRSPSLDERIAMFKNNFKSVPQAKNIDWKKLSEKLQDFSGSDIARLCQQAKRQLFKRLIVLQNKSKHMEEVITEEDLHRALKSTKSTKNEKWNSKYQEFFQEN